MVEFVEKTCVECGKTFQAVKRKGNEKKYCTTSCYTKHNNRTRLEQYHMLRNLDTNTVTKTERNEVILNFTGKEVKFLVGEAWITIPPLGDAKLVSEIYKEEGTGMLASLNIYVQCLPDSRDNCVFLVKPELGFMLSGFRKDIVVPVELVEETEKMIMCKKLCKVYGYVDYGKLYNEKQ